MTKHSLKPESRYWSMIATGGFIFIVFVYFTPYLVGIFSQGPQMYFGIVWFGLLIFVFIKWTNIFLGSERILINDQLISYRFLPFGLKKNFYKSDIELIASKWEYMTDFELTGASKLGVGQWRLKIKYKNKEFLLGRFLNKHKCREILNDLTSYGYKIQT